MSEIIKAEEGPKRADRKVTYHEGKCKRCGTTIYFFKMEKYSQCPNCGEWTEKPRNGEAITL